jgi:LPXTG-motif cell wall-anchored protein
MGRRVGHVAALAFVAILLGAQPAMAKFENATIRITGPGLEAPLELTGAGAMAWERYSGIFEQKWSAPNVQGSLSADADLGSEYNVAISFDCLDGTTGEFAETLYPYSPGGPQVFAPPDVGFCGMTVSPGYYPASVRLLHALVSAGLPRTPPEANQATPPGSSGASTSSSTVLALVGLFALTAAAGVIAVRRRSRAAV